MQTTPTESRFMALPPELRCLIYSFLPELVYKYIWPVVKLSPVGVCSWPYFRLPTPLLLVNKLVHQETKDATVQMQLQHLNEHYPPVIVVGPFTGLYTPRNTFLNTFCGLLSRHSGRNSCILNSRGIRRYITSWSNSSLRDRLGVQWMQIYERLPRHLGYSEKNLDMFITCTLTRMARNCVKEVQIRLLLCSTLEKRSMWDRRMLDHLVEYRVSTLANNYCDPKSVSIKEGVTIVLPTEQRGLFLDDFLSTLREKSIGFQVEEPSTLDRRLLHQLDSIITHQGTEES